jgi:hypothetical protein
MATTSNPNEIMSALLGARRDPEPIISQLPAHLRDLARNYVRKCGTPLKDLVAPPLFHTDTEKAATNALRTALSAGVPISIYDELPDD